LVSGVEQYEKFARVKGHITQRMEVCIIFMDLETTGLSVYSDEVVQLGATLVKATLSESGVLVHHDRFPPFCELVKCNRKVCASAAAVTGITNETVKNSQSLLTVLINFEKHLELYLPTGVERVLSGYNISAYDIPLLIADVQRASKVVSKTPQAPHSKAPQSVSKASVVELFRKWRISYVVDMFLFAKNHVDTTMLKRKINGLPSYTLGDVHMALLHRNISGAHNALADTNACADLYTECEAFRSMPVYTPTALHITNFMVAVNISLEKLANRAKVNQRLKDSHQQNVLTMLLKSQKRKRSDDKEKEC
jgi:DNA polymerase III alpha subunit (gram-positive type)